MPGTKRQILYDFTYMRYGKYSKSQIPGNRKYNGGYQGLRRGGKGYVWMGF